MTHETRGFRAIARAALVALPMIIAGGLPVAAQEPPPPVGPGSDGPGPMHGRRGDGPGPEGMHGGGPLAELARAEADQVAAQAIATLATAPLPDVQRTIRAWGVPTALRYYYVPPKAFHDAAVPGLVALVRAAEQQKQIPGTDADLIVDRLQHDGPPQ